VRGVAAQKEGPGGPTSWRGLRIASRDAAIVVVGSAAVALTFNAIRDDGLALVARAPYRILVPCPETAGDVEELLAADPRLGESRTLLIDARSRAEYDRWHAPGAAHVAYDYLAPTDPALLREIASSSSRRVVAYGDGEDPDSGEQLARELAGKGIRNVGYVSGGAEALRAAIGGDAQ
jgi:hypothetical protein